MARPGYVTVNLSLKPEDVNMLDSLGDSRAGTISALIKQESNNRKRCIAAGESESATALMAHVKEKLPSWTREQRIELIVEIARSLA